jgi:ABC-2 type transport system ATP-binding protein
MQEPPAVEVSGLSKRYGRLQAVHPVDMSIPKGEIFALLGSNGAGKTTFMKSILRLVLPDSGSARLSGVDTVRPASRCGVRYLPESVRFGNWAAPGFMHGAVERIRRESTRADFISRCEELGCADLVSRPFGRMSHGQLQRSALSIATCGTPGLLFLDEPSNGLDPEGRILVRELLRRMASEGSTIVINSHLLGEVEAICTMAAFMKDGRIVASGSLATLLRYKGAAKIRSGDAAGLAAWLRTAGLEASASGTEVEVPMAGEDEFPGVVAKVASSGIPFTSVEMSRENLEELFLRLVSREGGE